MGCSWRLFPAYPRCTDWQNNGIVSFENSRPFNWFALPFLIFFCFIIVHPFFIRSFAFKGCSWWLIPAHPWYAGWHKDDIIKSASESSRAFDWYAELHIALSDNVFITNLKQKVLSVVNWPPPYVQHYHLCSAFSMWRRLFSFSK